MLFHVPLSCPKDVYRLKTSLYGLKKSSKECNTMLDRTRNEGVWVHTAAVRVVYAYRA